MLKVVLLKKKKKATFFSPTSYAVLTTDARIVCGPDHIVLVALLHLLVNFNFFAFLCAFQKKKIERKKKKSSSTAKTKKRKKAMEKTEAHRLLQLASSSAIVALLEAPQTAYINLFEIAVKEMEVRNRELRFWF